MSSDDTVKVAVRIRPMIDSEKGRGCRSIVTKTATQPQVLVNSGLKTTEKYTYNFVFAPEDTQEMIYENAVRSMVLRLFDGYNVTILAYGQTGSGKTHTMGTTFNGVEDEEMGVIPRAVSEIFEKIASLETDIDFTVNSSFVELYQEKLYDLLSPNQREQSIVDIREVEGKVVIPNLTEKIVTNTGSTFKCLMDGSSQRAVGSTKMNSESSRSHAIFTITVQKIPKDDPTSATIAKFHLVDLAGSERAKKTEAVGEQFKEGVKINQGLLALGNVISALGSSNQNVGHVGYRDSKLTRLLQDSLGGNSMTLMIACVSPADYNCDETIGTLRYADRARKIKNKPIVNEDPKTAEINRLKAEIQSLRVELLSKSGVGMTAVEKCKSCSDPPTKAQLQKENREMAEKMQLALFEMAHRENVLTEYEETIESLNAKISDLREQIVQLDKANTTNMSPEQLREYEVKMHTVTSTILELTQHMKERNECIVQNSKPSESQSFNSSKRSSLADSEELAQTNDKYIKQQTEYQQELREVKQELNIKESLRIKLVENYEKFRRLNDEASVKAKIQDYEEQIKKMEKEHEELKAALRGKNGSVSVKLAEERRKRVQQLEAQIADVKQKNKVQAQLLKQHEKDHDEIKRMSNEIMEMKQAKVKLIKKMKSESDEFRVWKAQREKEIAQLRSKGRKLESEAVKKDLLHEKQRIVLQRKFEESNAANKRLKEALLRVQKNKENKQANKGGPVQKSTWLNEEIEVISSIVDIKQSYEQLIEARAELTKRLTQVKRQKPVDKDLIKQIEEEIEMHNAQITDLRGKINANDIDAKIKSIQDGYESLAQSRGIVRHLLQLIVENRGNFNTYFAQARDLKHANEALEEEKKEMAEKHKQKLEEVQQNMNKLTAENVDKQSILLKALASEGSQSELIELLQKQLNEKDAEIKRLKASKLVYKRPIKHILQEATFALNDTAETIIDSDDDNENDPDWRKTPMGPRSKRSKRSQSQNSTENDTTIDPVAKVKKVAGKSVKSTRASQNGCRCKKGCKEGHCGCRVNGNSCSESCGCKTLNNCTNIYGQDSDGSLKRERSIDEESTNNNIENKENVDEVVPCTPPKKLRTEDIINPYVYSHKKRNPIFTSNITHDN